MKMSIKLSKPKLVVVAIVTSVVLLASGVALVQAPAHGEVLTKVVNHVAVVTQPETTSQPSVPIVNGVNILSNVPAADGDQAKSQDVTGNSAGAVTTTTTAKAGATIDLDSLKLVNNQWGAPADENLICAVYLNQGKNFG